MKKDDVHLGEELGSEEQSQMTGSVWQSLKQSQLLLLGFALRFA